MQKNDTVYIMSDILVPESCVKTEIINEGTVPNCSSDIKVVTIETCLQSFDVQNQNGRIYGKDVVMEAIDGDDMIQNDIKHGQWIGEYGHPLDATPQRQVMFNPTTASHRILSYHCEGNLLLGKVETLAGGAGQMLHDRIMQGVPAAFSLRSLGTIDMETRRVKKPLKVLTYDAV